ncbi:unnamed protein product [Eruca vesicaria subsp. sativa]|uniref:Uncharacterized protein n=1 Tax=Eruca vesicaria subsp. sativa TaxID=29727 RepID=A0ABC8KZL8_ERUVS|nr:unnamed protein product [Eruca vesicaria subsp. sativa]
METNIYRRLGVPKKTIKKSRKRKANDDNHGQSGCLISGVPQTHRPTSRAKKLKPTVSSPGNQRRHRKCMRTPNAGEDGVQVEKTGNAVTTLTVHSNVLFMRPQCYVLRTNSHLFRRYRDEEPIIFAWEETNCNLYNRVKSARASHPSSSTYPASEPNVASTVIEDIGEPVPFNVIIGKVISAVVGDKKVEKPKLDVPKPVHVEENLEGFSSHVLECRVPDPSFVDERNLVSPTMEEDEKYESCKDNISNDSQLQDKETQAKRGHPVSDTDRNEAIRFLTPTRARMMWRVVVNVTEKYPIRFKEFTPQTQGLKGPSAVKRRLSISP